MSEAFSPTLRRRRASSALRESLIDKLRFLERRCETMENEARQNYGVAGVVASESQAEQQSVQALSEVHRARQEKTVGEEAPFVDAVTDIKPFLEERGKKTSHVERFRQSQIVFVFTDTSQASSTFCTVHTLSSDCSSASPSCCTQAFFGHLAVTRKRM